MSGSAQVTNGGSGVMIPTAGLEVPDPQIFEAKFWDETSWRAK